MIFMIGGTLVGILLGWLIVKFVPQKALGWMVLGLGALALAFITPGLVSILTSSDTAFSPVVTIPLGISCLVSGLGAVRKNERPWQVWLGLGLGAIPLLFWVAFIIGEILYPH
jgi:hypothetical protein